MIRIRRSGATTISGAPAARHGEFWRHGGDPVAVALAVDDARGRQLAAHPATGLFWINVSMLATFWNWGLG